MSTESPALASERESPRPAMTHWNPVKMTVVALMLAASVAAVLV